MVQIINRQNQKPKGFAESILGGIGENIGPAIQQYQQQQNQIQQMAQENEAAKRLGIDLSGIRDPKTRQEIISSHLQGQQKQRELEQQFQGQSNLQKEKYGFEEQLLGKKSQGEAQQKLQPFEAGLDVLKKMRQIRKKGNLGVGTSWSLSPTTQRDASEYEQLGKSLISLASTIPIRNQQEFQTLAEKLYDPTITDAHAEGILNAMERIINNSMKQFGQEDSAPSSNMKKERPPLTSFVG